MYHKLYMDRAIIVAISDASFANNSYLSSHPEDLIALTDHNVHSNVLAYGSYKS